MNRLRSLLAIIMLAGSAVLFAPDVAHADWDWDGIGTGSIGLVRPTDVATMDLQDCDDGKIATWKKSRLTFRIINTLGLDLHLVESVRQGVLLWNRVGSPYTLSEVKSGAADITIQIVPLVGLTRLGGANVVCSSGQAGIQSVAVRIGLTGLTPSALRNVSAHEIGHALGLDHAATPAGKVDLMNQDFALLAGNLRVLCPSNLDVQALRAKADPYSIPASEWSAKSC